MRQKTYWMTCARTPAPSCLRACCCWRSTTTGSSTSASSTMHSRGGSARGGASCFRTREAWETVMGAGPWFGLFDSLGLLGSWLGAADEQRVNAAFNLFCRMVDAAPDCVAELLEPYAGAGGNWRYRFVWLMSW